MRPGLELLLFDLKPDYVFQRRNRLQLGIPTFGRAGLVLHAGEKGVHGSVARPSLIEYSFMEIVLKRARSKPNTKRLSANYSEFHIGAKESYVVTEKFC